MGQVLRRHPRPIVDFVPLGHGSTLGPGYPGRAPPPWVEGRAAPRGPGHASRIPPEHPEIPDPQRLPTRALYCCRQRGLGGDREVGDRVLLVPGGSCWSLEVQGSPGWSQGCPPSPLSTGCAAGDWPSHNISC